MNNTPLILLSEDYKIDEKSTVSKILKDLMIESGSAIHFITNGNPCYVRIRNLLTGLYLDVQDINKSDPAIIGSTYGSVFIIKPSYLYFRMNICLVTNIKNNNNNNNWFIGTSSDSCMLKCFDTNLIDSQFYLVRCGKSYRIRCCYEASNLVGNIGKFLYMSRPLDPIIDKQPVNKIVINKNINLYNPTIYCDGDITTDGSTWKIEKLNTLINPTEIRNDHYQNFMEIINISHTNVSHLFPNKIKKVFIKNIKYGKYLNTNIINVGDINDTVRGDDDSMTFILRPDNDDKCVYISVQNNDDYINLYTLPQSNSIYIGAPDCNWSKFYVNKVRDGYTFQCYHRECNRNGGYGRFLRMIEENFNVISDGTLDDDIVWNVIPSK